MRKLKYAAAAAIKQRPALMARVWNMLPRLKFLLPHDRSYYGLRRFDEGGEQGLFLDVGANNGISALGFRKVCGPTSRIVSIEANPAHRPSLEWVAESDPRFDYRLVGLGREEGVCTLWTPYSGSTPITALASGDPDYCYQTAVRDYGERVASRLQYHPAEVNITTLDSLELAPTILKVDVEGLDFDVVRGGEETLDENRPVMLLEYTPAYSGPMIEWIKKKDYELKVLDPGTDELHDFDQKACDRDWERENLQTNIFAVAREKVRWAVLWALQAFMDLGSSTVAWIAPVV